MSYLNIQNHNQQAYPPYRPVKNNYIPPPPFDPSLFCQNNSQGAASQNYGQPNPYIQPPHKKPSQIFFKPIYKVPPPNFDQECGNQEVKIGQCQEKKLVTETKQNNSFKNPLNIKVVKQENLPFLCKKGIFKFKLGAVYAKKERIPDEYSCFIQMIESIFPCLSPDFKQPLNNFLSQEQLKAQELEEKAISQIINKEHKIYKIFYFNADDKPINIKNAQDYSQLNWQLANNKSLLHPTHGLKMFIVPKQGDSFLHRFSLGGDREVELTQQLWKLLFTDNNYIFNLREEKPLNKGADIDSDNVGVMREFLVDQLEESLEAVNVSDDGSEKEKEELKKEDLRSDVKKEGEVKRQLIELDEYSIIDRISEPSAQKRIQQDKDNDEEELLQNLKEQQVKDQKKQEQLDKQRNQEQMLGQKNQQQAKLQEKIEVQRQCKSDGSSEIDEQDIRTMIRQRIDTECRSLILQHFKNYDQDCKLEEIEDIIRSRLFVNCQQDQEIDSIPDINFQEVNYSQIKEADIEYILNPFEKVQQNLQERENFQQQQEWQKLEVELKQQVQDKLQIPEKQFKEQVNQQQEKKVQSIKYPIQKQGIIFQPAIKPQLAKQQNVKKEIEIPKNRDSIPSGIGMIYQPQIKQNHIQQPRNDSKPPQPLKPFNPYEEEQVKARPPPPRILPKAPLLHQVKEEKKRKGFFDKLKMSAAKFLNIIKGDDSQQNKRYKWAPMQMAAIIRHLSPQTDLLHAYNERVSNQKFTALPKKLITKKVRLINLSGHKWPQEVYISKVKGDKEISLESQNVNIRLKPGQEGIIEILIKTPKKEGLYKCIFSLKGLFPENRKLHFGELMGVQINVKKEQYVDKEQKVYEDAETLVRENLGTFEECLRSLRCNKLKIKKARKDLLLKFRK